MLSTSALVKEPEVDKATSVSFIATLVTLVVSARLKKFDRSLIEFEGLDPHNNYMEQDHLVAEELKTKIEEATNELPEKCREIFLKNRHEHMKYQEIADELNISIKTVEAQMSKALKHMREKLAEYITVLLMMMEFFKNP